MESLGHTCVEAVDGQDAVDAVRVALVEGGDRVFDVILMDNQMPVLLGSQAARIIRTELHHDGIMFGVTGNVLRADIEDYFCSGVDDVILKPLSIDKFLFSLDKALQSRGFIRPASTRE